MFVGLPAVPNGPVVDAQANLNAAVADFAQARTLSTDVPSRNSYTLALARAYHRLGNKAKAVEEAQALLTRAGEQVWRIGEVVRRKRGEAQTVVV